VKHLQNSLEGHFLAQPIYVNMWKMSKSLMWFFFSLSLSGDLSWHLQLLFLPVAIIDEDILRYERVKKKAYVRVVTTHGNLNLELHSDMVMQAHLCFTFSVFASTIRCSL